MMMHSGTIAGAALDVFANEPDVPLALRVHFSGLPLWAAVDQ